MSPRYLTGLKMTFKIFVILFICSTNGLEIGYQDNIIRSAVDVANNNFNRRVEAVVVSKDVPSELVNKFIAAYEGTVIIEANEFTKAQVIILIQSFSSFMDILDKLTPDLKGNSLIHSGARIMIVIISYPHELENINRILWKYYATDVVIVTEDRYNRIALYTYYPYKNHLRCQNVEPSLIGFMGNVSLRNLFDDKMRNLHGCPLYISTDKLFNPITEQKVTLQKIKQALSRLLSDAMNFTPIVSSFDFVNIDSDQSKNWSYALNGVLNGKSNISTCTVTMGIEGVGLLDFTMPYFRVRLGWLAPPPQPSPIWWPLYSPLSGYLWLILLVVILFVKSLPLVLKIKRVNRFCRRHFKNFDKLQSVAFRSWGVMVGQAVKVAPKRFRDFYIVGIWIWFTFVIRSAYQSVLIGALKSNVTFGKFESMKEAVAHGYTFGGKKDVLVHFEHDAYISENYHVIAEDEYSQKFRDVLNGKSKFVFAMFLEYAWAYCLTQGWSEEECGHVIPDSIMTVPVVVWMKKKSPFKLSTSTWLVRFLESGLLDKDTMKKPLQNSLRILEPTPLTVNQLLSCILCLLFGYFASVIVFMLEVTAFKTKAMHKFDKHILSKIRN